jgi:hypothetical protein
MLRTPTANYLIPRYRTRSRSRSKSPPARAPQRVLKKSSRYKHSGKDGTLEKEFLEGFEKGRVCLSIGTKGSGKSYTMLSYLKYALKHDLYDVYLLSLPVYQFEQHDSYDFLKKYRGKAKVMIFNRYDPIIFKKAIGLPNDLHKLILLDDSTGSFSFRAEPEELQFLAAIRHHNCSLWLVMHVLKSAIPPTIRAMIDYIYLHLNTNKKGLEAIYEEYLSIAFLSFKEFMEYYKRTVLDRQYNSLLINTREINSYDANTLEWHIIKKQQQ